MNAPLSIEQRRAFGLVAPEVLFPSAETSTVARSLATPVAFLDDSGNPVKILDQWHLSHAMAELPPPPSKATEYGKKCAADAVAQCRASSPAAPKSFGIGAADRRKLEAQASWRDTPRAHRMILARFAGLSPEIVDELDRNLSESEKSLLRGAALELRDSFAALTRSL